MKNRNHLANIFVSLMMLVAAGLLLNTVVADSAERSIIQLSIEDIIGPASDDYVERALDSAALRGAELVVIRMDTPGGLDSAMRAIIKNITNSPVPVASYVAPSGARAASAGTYILYASHIAAMAPGTNLGAATPVQIGGISPPDIKGKEKQDQPPSEAGTDAMKRKSINDAVAYIQSLAQLRGRNQAWAEKAVREAASLPASEALKLNVIDVVAASLTDLLQQVDGREVVVQGRKRILNTAGLTIIPLDPDWRNRLLAVITNPNIAYILMLIGIYGLIFEFSNPGSIVPGTIGAICLLLALYSFQLLPINYAGMALILLGIFLMVAEAYQPSFGVLGIGGLIAFVIGSIILMDTEAPGFGIDIAVIVTFSITSVLVFVLAIGMALKARRRPVVSGMEEILGGVATVIEAFDRQGKVAIHSETWNAQSHTALHKDQQVKVTAIKGLTLEVEPLNEPMDESILASTEEGES